MRLIRMSHSARAVVVLLWGLAACGPEAPPSTSNNTAGADMRVGDLGVADMPDDMPLPVDTPADLPPSPDMADQGAEDMPADLPPDMSSPHGRTIKDYIRCQTSEQCPVGAGTCVKEVTLNRAGADGRSSVPLAEVFTDLGVGEGVCTRVCTSDPTVCADLSVNGVVPDDAPHVCQLLVTGASPYPNPSPTLPFAEQLDPAQLVAGTPFGAICRPPFQLDSEVDDGLCAACQPGLTECAGSADCVTLGANRLARSAEAGQCLPVCDEARRCPSGFTCQALQLTDSITAPRCVPTAGSCTACLDADGDGRGVGRCGPADAPVTPHDCDDRDAAIYYDPDNPRHPFPAQCGQTDYNCNGLDDEIEQRGTDAHCTACGDRCGGEVANGQRACKTDQSTGVSFCGTTCAAGYADCDGIPENGCETLADDPSRMFYRDADGDGHGDPSDSVFLCGLAQIPAGYVRADSSDCDDADPQTFGEGLAGRAAVELCDSVDNNCDGAPDNIEANGALTCRTTEQGACALGTLQCQGSAFVCVAPAPAAQEVCNNGVDDNCDGRVDELDGTPGTKIWYRDADGDGYGDPNNTVQDCDDRSGDGYIDDASRAIDCDDTPGTGAAIYPGADELCGDAIDNDCNPANDGVIGVDGLVQYVDRDGDQLAAISPLPSDQVRPRAGDVPATLFATTPPDRRDSYLFCQLQAGASADTRDCNDNNPNVRPGVPERCATIGVDDDCNGRDESDPAEAAVASDAIVAYVDADGDGDGFKPASGQPTALTICPQPGSNPPAPPVGYASIASDCRDGDSAISSLVPELCDGVDNNCSGQNNEGCPSGPVDMSGSRLSGTIGLANFPATDLDCPAGSIITALTLNENASDVWWVQLHCRTLRIDEDSSSSINPTYSYTYRVGSPRTYAAGVKAAFGADRTIDCGTDGSGLHELFGRQQNGIRALGGKCASPTSLLLQQQPPFVTEWSSSLSQLQGPWGWPNGREAYSSCNASEVGVGARVYVDSSTNRLEAIRLRCARTTPRRQ